MVRPLSPHAQYKVTDTLTDNRHYRAEASILTFNVRNAAHVSYPDRDSALHAFDLALERGEVEILFG